MSKQTLFWTVLCHLLVFSTAGDYNVIKFGAKPNGKSDSTNSFKEAWSFACNSSNPATMYVPHGRFVIGPIRFEGPCRNDIVVRIDGVIVAPEGADSLTGSDSWILFYDIERLNLIGGTFDAVGAEFWSCRMSKKSNNCPIPSKSISLERCDGAVVTGLKSINSRFFHIAVNDCKNVLLQKVTISAPSWSPNTDGVHIQSSSGIVIRDSTIRTGDDCVSIGPGSKNLTVNGVSCGPGHGISIGSLGETSKEEGVENIRIDSCVFNQTQNGLRIKTWGRHSNGFARNIVFQNCVMNNVYNPIIIDQNYCPEKNCPHQSSGVEINGVTYKNIKGTSASKVAMSFSCSGSHPCRHINLQDIHLSGFNGPTPGSYCKNVKGSTTGLVVPTSCF